MYQIPGIANTQCFGNFADMEEIGPVFAAVRETGSRGILDFPISIGRPCWCRPVPLSLQVLPGINASSSMLRRSACSHCDRPDGIHIFYIITPLRGYLSRSVSSPEKNNNLFAQEQSQAQLNLTYLLSVSYLYTAQNSLQYRACVHSSPATTTCFGPSCALELCWQEIV